MPSTSKKQHDFMEAIAHSPKFAKQAGVPQKVGKDFATADAAPGAKFPPKAKPGNPGKTAVKPAGQNFNAQTHLAPGHPKMHTTAHH